MKDIFKFKNFTILQKDNSIKVNKDGILLAAWANCESCQRILDIGTGTGVIALLVAHKNHDAVIDAVEIDEISCLEAQHNVSQSDASERINVIKISIQDFANNTSETYDHILCNPPFFSGGSLSSAGDKKLLRQTAKLGHGDLLIAVSKLLKEGAKFSLILPFMEGLRFIEMATRYHMNLSDKVNVRQTIGSSIDKMLLTFIKGVNPIDLKESDFVINNADGSYTTEYAAIVEGF